MPRDVKVEAPELRLDPERALRPFEWHELFDGTGPVEVEIGIGKGRFFLASAESRRETRFLGVEWANRYLRRVELGALRRKLDNVRFARVDAREMLHCAMPSASVTAFYVFYPDPWPKRRHQLRRLIRPDTADHLARTLIDAGKLHVATDHAGYWEAIHKVLDRHPALERLAAFGDACFPLPVEGPLTNFEAKYRIEGRPQFRGSWRRRGDVDWTMERATEDQRPVNL